VTQGEDLELESGAGADRRPQRLEPREEDGHRQGAYPPTATTATIEKGAQTIW
jgi:hypothetical protein